MERTGNYFFTLSTGYISLLMGVVAVILHNVWVLDWTLIITILGWATLSKGIMKTAFPEYINKRAQAFKKNQALESAFLILLGGFLFIMSLL